MGLSLGAWLQLQRQIRSGTCGGRLTQQQIERLDSIGMRWDNYSDLAWTKGYEEAKQYYAKHRNLMVPANWKTADGYPLGRWISNKRTEKLAGRLDEEKITSLEQVGMVWDAFSEKWERGFAAAAQYYAEHGNLIMPVTYTTKDGLRLGVWVRNQKKTYANGTLQQEKAARLEGIGIRWEQNNYDFQWSEAYAAAKLYFEEYGNLNVPSPIPRRRRCPRQVGWHASSMHATIRARATASSRRSARRCWIKSVCSGKSRTHGSIATTWRRITCKNMEIY